MKDMYNMREQVGYAFVPVQQLGEIYAPEDGMERGTIFPELDLPISVYGPAID